MVYENRIALSLAGVHTPRMAGISGSETEGADSIVISGGYEDDLDLGDEIIYTGQGGNDPATGAQIADQALRRGNLSLALSMQEGLPVRVIRGANHRSPFSPPIGYRYDGLYRVEDCWHETGKSGYLIWRFRLRKIGSDRSSLIVREERESYDAGPAPRRRVQIARIIRNTETARAVKRMHDYRCQVCGLRLETPGGPYAEGAHIRPLGEPHNGPDTAENILCLCPNHHVLFDAGALTIQDDLIITGTMDRLRTVRGHAPHPEHLRYHREHYGQAWALEQTI